MLFGSLIKIWNHTFHMKKQKHQNGKSIGEKLNNKGLMFFVKFFSCDLQDFKFQYVNRKVFGASFLYWVDFTCQQFKKNWKKNCKTWNLIGHILDLQQV